MNIDKLRTQIQFEKYLDSLTDSEFCELENDEIWEYNELEIDGLRWHCAKSHIKHLERTLTKEMFVNNESKDWFNKDDSINVKIQLNWMEAEKKVIFEDGYKKAFDNPLKFRTNNVLINFSSMGSLAEKTNGELKLKNFEI